MFTEKEKQEIVSKVNSEELKNDMRYLAAHRQSIYKEGSKDNVDRYMEFLKGFNEFIGHQPKTFRKIEGKHFKM